MPSATSCCSGERGPPRWSGSGMGASARSSSSTWLMALVRLSTIEMSGSVRLRIAWHLAVSSSFSFKVMDELASRTSPWIRSSVEVSTMSEPLWSEAASDLTCTRMQILRMPCGMSGAMDRPVSSRSHEGSEESVATAQCRGFLSDMFRPLIARRSGCFGC